MRSVIDFSCPPGSSQLSRARHCASSVSRAAAATSAARRVEQAEQEQSRGSASMSRASRQMLGGCPQRLRRRLEICRCVAHPALQPAGPGCCRPQGAALALPRHLQAQHFAQHCLVMLSVCSASGMALEVVQQQPPICVLQTGKAGRRQIQYLLLAQLPLPAAACLQLAHRSAAAMIPPPRLPPPAVPRLARCCRVASDH